MSERRKFTDYEKKTVYEQYNGKCAICGKKLPKKHMTIAHKLPFSRGGSNGIDNLLLSCWDCSHAKNNLTMDEFFMKVQEIFHHNKHEILEMAK